jgi:hypothetical protein
MKANRYTSTVLSGIQMRLTREKVLVEYIVALFLNIVSNSTAGLAIFIGLLGYQVWYFKAA